MKGIVILNRNKVAAIELFDKIKEFFKTKNIEIVSENEIMEAQFAVVLGGDGTLLRASKTLILNQDIDVFAVNMGSLGFLTEIKEEDFFITFERYLKSDYKKEVRNFLNAKIGKLNFNALNEVIVSKLDMISRIVDLKLRTKNMDICNCKADGFIVSGPTGTTAYNLSANGPIVMPQVNSMTLTALNPHSLSWRSIVISDKETIMITPDQKSMIIIDGEQTVFIEPFDEVEISYSSKKINLILPENRNYYDILKEKIKWGDNLC